MKLFWLSLASDVPRLANRKLCPSRRSYLSGLGPPEEIMTKPGRRLAPPSTIISGIDFWLKSKKRCYWKDLVFRISIMGLFQKNLAWPFFEFDLAANKVTSILKNLDLI